MDAAITRACLIHTWFVSSVFEVAASPSVELNERTAKLLSNAILV